MTNGCNLFHFTLFIAGYLRQQNKRLRRELFETQSKHKRLSDDPRYIALCLELQEDQFGGCVLARQRAGKHLTALTPGDFIQKCPIRQIQKYLRYIRPRLLIQLFFRARFARLSKVLVFVANRGAPVRGMERGKLLSLRSRERETLFQGSLCSPLKSGGFCGNFGCTRLEVVKVW